MATELPASPFIDEAKPRQPVERPFRLNEKLFMDAIVQDPLPDAPPLFLSEPGEEFLRTIEHAQRVIENTDRIGGFADENFGN